MMKNPIFDLENGVDLYTSLTYKQIKTVRLFPMLVGKIFSSDLTRVSSVF